MAVQNLNNNSGWAKWLKYHLKFEKECAMMLLRI